MAKDTTPLEVDVDVRLAALWALVWERDTALAQAMDEDQDLADAVGSALRAAYGRGYCDALQEEREGRRAELATAHGYRAL
jgi:hypothetical protein